MWNSYFLTVSTFRAIKPLVADPPHTNLKFKGNKCFSLLTLVPDHELSSRAMISNNACPDPREGTPWPQSCATAEEGEEIVPVLAASLFRLLNLSRALGHGPAAGLARLPPRDHRVPPWAVSKVGDDGGGCSSHGVRLTARRIRCTWISEPGIRGAKAGNFYVMGAWDTSVAWEWNSFLWGHPWCILLTNLAAHHFFWHIQDGKGCLRAKHKSIWCIKEERMKRFIMEEKSLTCFWWEKTFFAQKPIERVYLCSEWIRREIETRREFFKSLQ